MHTIHDRIHILVNNRGSAASVSDEQVAADKILDLRKML